jgi:hypothetical protein
MTDLPDLNAMPIADIVKLAQDKWVALTGVAREQRSFTMGDLDVRSMNEIMDDATRLDPEGTTTYLLLETFLREFLERKTFTAAQIMKDYDTTSAYLKQAEELFSIVQSDRALEMAAGFRARVAEGVQHYGADGEDVQAMIDNADVLPVLRRDALHSLDSLKPYQFLQGEPGMGPAQVIEHVYMGWNVNDLLAALRDMPVNGIAVVLIRDPESPDRSYFSFAMRNGDNVILFTDKNKPAYPGQEDVLAGRGGRGTGRSYMSRAWENHFPYQLIKTSFDENDDLVFDAETAPVAANKSVIPLMKISELPAHQVIWLTMMLSLISDKFWKNSWKAENLSFTGQMVRDKSLLVTDGRGDKLPVAKGYTEISLEEISVDDVSGPALDSQLRNPSQGVNKWMEDRYRHTVSHDVVNQWKADVGMQLLLPSKVKKENEFWDDKRDKGTEVAPGIICTTSDKSGPSWEQAIGYKLLGFSSTDFGTEQEIRDDRLFIARNNFAQQIQKSADEEYDARKEEVAEWYFGTVQENLPGLLSLIAERHEQQLNGEKPKFDKTGHRLMRFADIQDYEFRHVYSNSNALGEFTHKTTKGCNRLCVMTDAVSSYRGMFEPRNAEQLAIVCGCEISDLPDVLQNWAIEKDYVGNHLLNRLDPMDTSVHDPWKRFSADVNVYLSKRGLAQVMKMHNAPANEKKGNTDA